jgi:hypothetical protein
MIVLFPVLSVTLKAIRPASFQRGVILQFLDKHSDGASTMLYHQIPSHLKAQFTVERLDYFIIDVAVNK